MNPKNYASLRSSQSLFEAGIILDTEAYWCLVGKEFQLKEKDNISVCYPAPTMYEAWEQLPVSVITGCMGFFRTFCDSDKIGRYLVGYKNSISGYLYSVEKENPADAIIDLLIWNKEYYRPDGR